MPQFQVDKNYWKGKGNENQWRERKGTKMNKKINSYVGGYRSYYRLIEHRDGSLSVKKPSIGRSKNVVHRTLKIHEKLNSRLINIFNKEHIMYPDGIRELDYLIEESQKMNYFENI